MVLCNYFLWLLTIRQVRRQRGLKAREVHLREPLGEWVPMLRWEANRLTLMSLQLASHGGEIQSELFSILTGTHTFFFNISPDNIWHVCHMVPGQRKQNKINYTSDLSGSGSATALVALDLKLTNPSALEIHPRCSHVANSDQVINTNLQVPHPNRQRGFKVQYTDRLHAASPYRIW